MSAGSFDQTTTAFHQVEARPTGQLTTPPDNSIVSPTATSFPNLDSACPTADGEFATVRHQPWDFATRRGILQLSAVDGASLCQETGVRWLYGGCWWVREVTCPKSQRAGFELAALDDRAAPECPPGPASSLFASRRSCR